MKIFRNILWGLVIFNIISVIMFFLPPGRAYYMPEILANITMYFVSYVIFGLSLSGIGGVLITLGLIIYRKIKKHEFQKQYIVLLIIFLLTIPLGWLLFNMAMSV